MNSFIDNSDTSLYSQQPQLISVSSTKTDKVKIGFIYDIPKTDSITSQQIKEIFESENLEVRIQLIKNDNKPFFTARVKFTNAQHFETAVTKLRYFQINGKMCRLLGFEPHLAKTIQTSLDMSSSNYGKSQSSSMSRYQDLSSIPDNSFSDCNIFVKCIDKSLNAKDLYSLFEKYGEVKSAKLSLNTNHTSRGYGFVWFSDQKYAK